MRLSADGSSSIGWLYRGLSIINAIILLSIRRSPAPAQPPDLRQRSVFWAKWKEDAKQVAGSLGRVTVTFPTYIHGYVRAASVYISNFFWDLPAHRKGVTAGVQFGARHGKPLATGCQSRVAGPAATSSSAILFYLPVPSSIHKLYPLHTCNFVALEM